MVAGAAGALLAWPRRRRPAGSHRHARIRDPFYRAPADAFVRKRGGAFAAWSRRRLPCPAMAAHGRSGKRPTGAPRRQARRRQTPTYGQNPDHARRERACGDRGGGGGGRAGSSHRVPPRRRWRVRGPARQRRRGGRGAVLPSVAGSPSSFLFFFCCGRRRSAPTPPPPPTAPIRREWPRAARWGGVALAPAATAGRGHPTGGRVGRRPCTVAFRGHARAAPEARAGRPWGVRPGVHTSPAWRVTGRPPGQ